MGVKKVGATHEKDHYGGLMSMGMKRTEPMQGLNKSKD
jgi:hypothetical protein